MSGEDIKAQVNRLLDKEFYLQRSRREALDKANRLGMEIDKIKSERRELESLLEAEVVQKRKKRKKRKRQKIELDYKEKIAFVPKSDRKMVEFFKNCQFKVVEV